MSGGCDRQEPYEAQTFAVDYIKQLTAERDAAREECGLLRAKLSDLRADAKVSRLPPNDAETIDGLMRAARNALSACRASLAAEPAVRRNETRRGGRT